MLRRVKRDFDRPETMFTHEEIMSLKKVPEIGKYNLSVWARCLHLLETFPVKGEDVKIVNKKQYGVEITHPIFNLGIPLEYQKSSIK